MQVYRDHEPDDWGEDEADFCDDDEPLVPCPSCRGEVLEDVPRCPHCGQYLSTEDHSRSYRPAWVTLTALICLAVAVWWIFTPA